MEEQATRLLSDRDAVTALVALFAFLGYRVWRVLHATVKVPREQAKLKIAEAAAADRRVLEKAKVEAEVREIDSRNEAFRVIAQSQGRLADHSETNTESLRALVSCQQQIAEGQAQHSRQIAVCEAGIQKLLEDRQRGVPIGSG